MKRIWGRAVLIAFLSMAGAPYAAPGVDMGRLATLPHPRTLDLAALQTNMALRAILQKSIEADMAFPLPAEPAVAVLTVKAELARRSLDIQSIAFGEEDRILRMALSALTLQDDALAVATKQRVVNLTGWSPKGSTGHFNHDQAGRAVAWSLALAYDWLYERWSAEERRKLLAAIKARVGDMLSAPVQGLPTGWAGLDWGRKLDRWSYDSHGAVTLARLAVICAVLAGEDALFDRCAHEMVPRYLVRPIPWGGAEGGYANGTAYASWDVLDTHFVVWHLLGKALDVDLWQGDWAKGYLNYIAYFLPPGTPRGLFGDAAENGRQGYQHMWATQARAYAAGLPSRLADWYAHNLSGENPLHLALLLAPQRDWSKLSDPLPAGTPHAIHLSDIGWVAMHSSLGERTRTSVYFKSSPYGSYNHSHADQNSFVINAHGQALAIDSGYYDFYGSPHWKDWYKQTRAHNAITFDGGQGQLHDTMAAKGKITRFEHHADYDIATGDAAEAYGGALERAVRSIVYLRPGAVLVHDSLASVTPRTWEWNLHALSVMKEEGPRSLEIGQEGARLCVTMLGAPEGAFAQTDLFAAEPQGNYARQWHARYTSTRKSAAAEFLAFLDVGCGRKKVSLRREGRQLSVLLEGRRIDFGNAGRVDVH